VDVQDPVDEGPAEHRRQDPHVSRQADEVDVFLPETIDDGPVIILAA